MGVAARSGIQTRGAARLAVRLTDDRIRPDEAARKCNAQPERLPCGVCRHFPAGESGMVRIGFLPPGSTRSAPEDRRRPTAFRLAIRASGRAETV